MAVWDTVYYILESAQNEVGLCCLLRHANLGMELHANRLGDLLV